MKQVYSVGITPSIIWNCIAEITTMFLSAMSFAKPYWKMLLTITLLIVVMAGLNQVEPFITKEITDILVEKEASIAWSSIFTTLLILLTVKIIQSILNATSFFITNIFSVKLESHLKQIGFDHLMRLSLDFFHDQPSGKVMSKLDRGVNRLSGIVSNFGIHSLPSITTAVVAFSIVVFHEWRVAILTVIAFIPYALISRWRFKKDEVLERQEYKLYDEQYSHFFEVISSMQLIKAFRSEDFERKKFIAFFKEYLALRTQMQWNSFKAVSADLILEAFSWSMYAYIVYLTWLGDITVGTLILLVGLIQLIRGPLWQINWIFWEIKRAQIGAKDFMKIISIQPRVTDPSKPVTLKTVEGKIEFKNVSFIYEPQQIVEFDSEINKGREVKPSRIENLKVFDDISFTIEPNKTTALVGPSGVGKSTIASLIMRFFDVSEGSIMLDGVDIREMKQHDLRLHLGLVSQDSNLFAETIEENLRYAKPTATEAEMLDACKVAHADEFISQLPEGLKTIIGERGVKLSGGQRQRLSLARTVLRDPKIIILDEATSALDSESEMYIQQALKKLLSNRTAIIIAHRLSTIQRADNIIVFKEQKILEQGTHAELMKRDDLYASLFKIQSGDVEKLREWDLVA